MWVRFPLWAPGDKMLLLEIGVMLYLLIGICLYLTYLDDIRQHSKDSKASKFIRRIIYIVTFIISVLLWPLLIGA